MQIFPEKKTEVYPLIGYINMNKYIKKDLNQSEKLQVIALNNILAAFEAKEIKEYNTRSISINVIVEVLHARYGKFKFMAGPLDMEYYFSNDLVINIKLNTGNITIYYNE